MIARKLLRVVRRSVMSGKESVAFLKQPLEHNDPEVCMRKLEGTVGYA